MLKSFKVFSNLVVLPHSVFALPFALASLLTATHGKPPLRVLLLVIVCMVLARTAAMAYNRLVDADIDAKNPRTQNRDIPAGRIRPWQVRVIVLICFFAFIGTCYFINPLCFKLSPLAMGIVFFYSHTKRFTWTSHLFLGLALGVAPVGAWIAATGAFAPEPFWLMMAVIFFLAGFDILYATQDEAFDKKAGLQSWVVRWGIGPSLLASRFFHFGMLGFLAGFGAQAAFPRPYYMGIGLIGALLLYQHLKAYKLEKAGGRSHFTLSPSMMKMNGWVSVLYFAVVAVTIWA
ncbi:MAG TPA: UbiA-like polyprenyltransferase [bacterium]|nr:UbiA-like polyprenyltransferase [bacterium]